MAKLLLEQYGRTKVYNLCGKLLRVNIGPDMGVPSFADLGRGARDVFRTGYHYGQGLVKLNIKTKSNENFELINDMTLNVDKSKITGLMGTNFKIAEFGGFSQKWSTDGTMIMGHEYSGELMEGATVLSQFIYNPESAAKSAKIGIKFTSDKFNADCAVSNDLNSNVNIFGSAVVACKDLSLGYQGAYDTGTKKLTKNDIGLAFDYRNYGFYLRCTSIPREFGLSILYKVNTKWDATINGILARDEAQQQQQQQVWTVGAAAMYKIDANSTIRFKLNTECQFAASLWQKFNEAVSLTLSFNVDGADLRKGGHKVGLACDLQV